MVSFVDELWTTARTCLWQTEPETRYLGLIGVHSVALTGRAELEGLLPGSLPFIGITDGATLEIRHRHVGRADALESSIPIVRLSDCHFNFILPSPVDIQDDHGLTVYAEVLCTVEILNPEYTPPEPVTPPHSWIDALRGKREIDPIDFERRVRRIVRSMLRRI